MNYISVSKVSDTSQLEMAFQIRREVFVDEQKVPLEEEIDEYEDESTHFLCLFSAQPAGAARWRFTEKGIKLERFAVKKHYRGKGVGSALVSAVLKDIGNHPGAPGKMYYLHSQLDAVPLYAKFGFQKIGDMFEECNIKHYKMVKKY
ncbi:MAG: GNAT family N-acetyltransferase [Bacteroidota bacterium]|nr:GNAT family N-acetyltransferase [Bacteroidota bacterium]